MTVYYTSHSDPVGFLVADLTLGVTSLLLFLLSLLLNTIILLYYSRKTPSNNVTLYKIMAFAYVSSTSFQCPLMAYNFLKPMNAPDSHHIISVLISFITILALNLAGWIVTLVSGLRLYTLRYPLDVVPWRRCGYLVGGCVAVSSLNMILLFFEARTPSGMIHWDRRKQFIFDMESEGPVTFASLLQRSLFFINLILCLIICCLTSYLLCPDRVVGRDRENIGAVKERIGRLRHSTMTIFRLNVIYTVTLIYMLVLIILVYTLDDHVAASSSFMIATFLAFPVCPLALAVANPLVLIVRSAELRKFVVRVCVKRDIPEAIELSRTGSTLKK